MPQPDSWSHWLLLLRNFGTESKLEGSHLEGSNLEVSGVVLGGRGSKEISERALCKDNRIYQWVE